MLVSAMCLTPQLLVPLIWSLCWFSETWSDECSPQNSKPWMFLFLGVPPVSSPIPHLYCHEKHYLPCHCVLYCACCFSSVFTNPTIYLYTWPEIMGIGWVLDFKPQPHFSSVTPAPQQPTCTVKQGLASVNTTAGHPMASNEHVLIASSKQSWQPYAYPYLNFLALVNNLTTTFWP